MAENNKKIRRGIELYIDGKEVKNDIRAIEAESRKLTKEIKSMTLGSKEYIATQKRLKECNKILAEHRAGLREVKKENVSLAEKASGLIAKYGALFAGISAGLAGVLMTYNKFRSKLNEREEGKAGVKALTGLGDEDIQWLEDRAKELSTVMDENGIRIRQSATEILDAFKLVGSAKPDLLQNKEALVEVTKQALILSQASGMELKSAVDAVTLSMNQYGAASSEAARYTNVMAAGSKFGAAAVDSVTEAVKRSGVAASTAKVPIEELVGSIEALAEKGIKDQVAGTGLKTFFLKLEAGAKETRPSVVGLQTALERLRDANMDATAMTKMFGLEAYTVAQALISGADKVQYYTKAVTGTNTAMEQAAIMSDTATAKMAQAKNAMAESAMVLAQQLQPVFSAFMGYSSKIIKALPEVIRWVQEYGGELIILGTTIVVLQTRIKVMAALTDAWNLATKAISMTMAGFRTAMVLTNEAIIGCSAATSRLSATLASQNILVKGGTALVALLRAAYYTLTLQLGAAKNAMEVFKVALGSSGIGLLILGIGAATAAIYHHVQGIRKAAEARRKAAKEERETLKNYYEEKGVVERLVKVLDSETSSLNAKKDALLKLREIAPEYQAQLTTEGKLINDNRDALDNYLASLKKKLMYEANEGKLRELYGKLGGAQDEEAAASTEYWRIKQQNALQGVDTNSVGYKVSSWVANSALGRLLGWDKGSEAGAKTAWDNAKTNVAELEGQIADLESKIGKLAEEAAEASSATTTTTGNATGSGKTETETEKAKRIRKEMARINALYDERAAKAKADYIKGDIETEEQYTSTLQAIEMARLNALMEIAGLEPEKRMQLADRLMDIEVNLRKKIDSITRTSSKASLDQKMDDLEKQYEAQREFLQTSYEQGIIPTQEKLDDYLLKLQEKFNDDMRALKEQSAHEQLADLDDEEDAVLANLREQRSMMLLTEEEYEREVLRIKMLYADKKKAIADKSKDDEARVAREESEIIVSQNEMTLRKVKEMQEAMKDAIISFGEEMGSALADIFADEQDAWKSMAKAFLKTAIDMVERYITITAVGTTSFDVMKSGFAGFATAAIKVAAIKAAFAAAKGLVDNWWTGGFTPGGRWDEPQGVVHSNEFVANRFATANPNVLPVLNLIDAAQKSGSISRLTGDEIAAVASHSAPAARGSYGSPAGVAQGQSDSGLLATLGRLEKVMDRATDAYETPSPAFCFLNGQGGINDAQRLNDLIKDNAKLK